MGNLLLRRLASLLLAGGIFCHSLSGRRASNLTVSLCAEPACLHGFRCVRSRAQQGIPQQPRRPKREAPKFCGIGKQETVAGCIVRRTTSKVFPCVPKALPAEATEYIAPFVGSWAGESLVASYELPVQAATVLAIYAALACCSAVLAAVLTRGAIAWSIMFPSGPLLLGIRISLALPLSAIFIGIGVLHLWLPGDYAGIVPPFGTWGIWPVPGPAVFHVSWTGVAHILCGIALFLSEIIDAIEWICDSYTFPWRPPPSEKLCACLLIQTLAVSPSNVYMFTHGENTLSYLAKLGPIPYPEGHVYAFAGVSFLIGVLAALASLDSERVRRRGAEPLAQLDNVPSVLAVLGVFGAVTNFANLLFVLGRLAIQA